MPGKSCLSGCETETSRFTASARLPDVRDQPRAVLLTLELDGAVEGGGRGVIRVDRDHVFLEERAVVLGQHGLRAVSVPGDLLAVRGRRVVAQRSHVLVQGVDHGTHGRLIPGTVVHGRPLDQSAEVVADAAIVVCLCDLQLRWLAFESDRARERVALLQITGGTVHVVEHEFALRRVLLDLVLELAAVDRRSTAAGDGKRKGDGYSPLHHDGSIPLMDYETLLYEQDDHVVDRKSVV